MRFKLFSAFLGVILFSFTSCRSVVSPHEWVVSTATCWNTYTVSKAGDYVPKLYTSCDRMVILPATNLSAELWVDTKFRNKVAGGVKINYNWRISDPIKFIQSAKSVISCSTDDDKKIKPEDLEEIENSVVDKILSDIMREYVTPDMDPSTSEMDIEKSLFRISANKVADRGVEFSNMSVNVTLSSQIEEALDIISALRFYRDAGEEALGRDVIKAKAGSANITTK